MDYDSQIKQATKRFKSLANSASAEGAKLAEKASEGLRRADQNHESIAEHADTVAKATRVAAGVAVAGAAVAAPTGLTAVGVALGVVSAPVITAVAPVLLGVAAGAITLSAAASLYSKYRKRKLETREPATEHAPQSE